MILVHFFAKIPRVCLMVMVKAIGVTKGNPSRIKVSCTSGLKSLYSLVNYFVLPRFTDEGSLPEMRIWSILLIKSD